MRILLLSCLMMLVACVAPQNTGDMKSAEPPPPMGAVEKKCPACKVAIEPKPSIASPAKFDCS